MRGPATCSTSFTCGTLLSSFTAGRLESEIVTMEEPRRSLDAGALMEVDQLLRRLRSLSDVNGNRILSRCRLPHAAAGLSGLFASDSRGHGHGAMRSLCVSALFRVSQLACPQQGGIQSPRNDLSTAAES